MSMPSLIGLMERGLVPDVLVRYGIRRLDAQHLAEDRAHAEEYLCEIKQAFLRMMDGAPIAVVPDRANEQHYELPPAFFEQVLGPRRKYSCCYYEEPPVSLAQAEEESLRRTCENALLDDGQRILELGCGWGSLSLWMAGAYPKSSITAVSNSAPQGAYIRERAAAAGLSNLTVLTADMNQFEPTGPFDRVVSVEMFEHMRNWRRLFGRIADWLGPKGRFFLHIFVHRAQPYLFDEGGEDWMSRHFFAGGMMPSDDLPLYFQDALRIEGQWRWDGVHYQRTANDWLARLDARREAILPILAETYGADRAEVWFQRWRVFFMACAELWGFAQGREWWVAHYRFAKR